MTAAAVIPGEDHMLLVGERYVAVPVEEVDETRAAALARTPSGVWWVPFHKLMSRDEYLGYRDGLPAAACRLKDSLSESGITATVTAKPASLRVMMTMLVEDASRLAAVAGGASRVPHGFRPLRRDEIKVGGIYAFRMWSGAVLRYRILEVPDHGPIVCERVRGSAREHLPLERFECEWEAMRERKAITAAVSDDLRDTLHRIGIPAQLLGRKARATVSVTLSAPDVHHLADRLTFDGAAADGDTLAELFGVTA